MRTAEFFYAGRQLTLNEFSVLLKEYVEHRLSNQLGGRIAEFSGAEPVHRQHCPGWTDHEIHYGVVFKYFSPLLFTLSQRLLGALALGDVVAAHQHRCRAPVPVSKQRPAAGDEDRCAISFVIDKLAFPPADAKQFGLDLVERQGNRSRPEFGTNPTHRFGA